MRRLDERDKEETERGSRKRSERRTAGVYTSVASQVKVTAKTKGNRAYSGRLVTKPQTHL